MTAFDAMHDALFADANMAVAAMVEPFGGGVAMACRAILSQPTEVLGVAGMEIAADTTIVEVRRSEIPSPQAGDTVVTLDAAGGETGRYIVQGEPKLDDLRIVWTLDTRPQGI
ncbi:hypothetical protein FFK22_008810 [Mycobacterium sp. KBS0706]|uniref:head-tail joining protein n=1 Tax=Mycobacterium sp. KBS0706 TaxID=2578109 RepID=UPI00110FAE7D|nr:hypothetical protein [Mycobacterium sp. KBS0706]TSD89071.1 hypothetical protein FFK22_008810 [Mycobacterium sp. KBS0706]